MDGRVLKNNPEAIGRREEIVLSSEYENTWERTLGCEGGEGAEGGEGREGREPEMPLRSTALSACSEQV
jgi:hypothetical protein